jgi:hypothetical protein
MKTIQIRLISPQTCTTCGTGHKIEVFTEIPEQDADNTAKALFSAHERKLTRLGWRGGLCPKCVTEERRIAATLKLIDARAEACARFGQWRDSRKASRPQGDEAALRRYTRSLRYCAKLQSLGGRIA